MKRMLLFLTAGMLILLTACGNGKENTVLQKEELSYVKGETLLVSHKETLTEGENWRQTHYIKDTLYYSEVASDNQFIYAMTDDQTAELKLKAEDVVVWSFTVDEEGNIYALSLENTEEGRQYYVFKTGADGVEQFKNPLSGFAEYFEGESSMDAAVSDKGYCVLTTAGVCLMWNLQGEEISALPSDWFPQDAGVYLGGDYGLLNGSRGIYVYHVAGNQVYLQAVDIENAALGEEIMIELPISMETSHVVSDGGIVQESPVKVYSGYEKGLYISDEEKLYSYDETTKELSEIVGWTEPGMSVKRDWIQEVTVDEQGIPTLYGYDRENEEGISYYMTVKRVEEFEQKTVEIGYLSINEPLIETGVDSYVKDFNSSQSEINVIYKSYDDLTDLHLALVQGQGPDILNLADLDIDEYVEKGILENLDPYFEASDTFKKEDILPALRESMSRGGSVYFLFPYFSIKVLILNNDYTGNGIMTTDEFLSLPVQGDESYLCDIPARSLLRILLNCDLEQYIDWEKKTCRFDDGRFAALLENVKRAKLPESVVWPPELTPAEQIYQGRYTTLIGKVIGNIIDYRDFVKTFNGYAEAVGYPNQKREEIYPIQSVGLPFGINSASEQKEAAWEFLDYFIHKQAKEAEMHRDLSSNFSILENAFELQLYPEPAPGAKRYYHYQNQYTNELYEQDFVVTDKQREELRNIVDNAAWFPSDGGLSGTIGMIIDEEAYTFFDGTKSAEEVADIIQSRVSIYMAE